MSQETVSGARFSTAPCLLVETVNARCGAVYGTANCELLVYSTQSHFPVIHNRTVLYDPVETRNLRGTAKESGSLRGEAMMGNVITVLAVNPRTVVLLLLTSVHSKGA
jgi:hypothetical protein